MNGKKIIGILIAGIILAVICSVIPTSADYITDTIERGEEKGWFLDPGDTLTVYYYPDGSTCTMAWKDNWFYWIMNNPFSTINTYCASGINGPWYHLYSDYVGPYYESHYLPLLSGVYKFEIHNYRNGDMVYLKIY